MAFDEQDILHAVRSIRNLVHMSERRVAGRCQIVLSSTDALRDGCSPHPLAQEHTTLLTDSAFFSCAKRCIDDSRLSPDLHKDTRVTLNKSQKSDISNGAAFITETNQFMWSLLTNNLPHGRPILYVVTPATEARVGHFAKVFDPGENGLQLIRMSFFAHSISERQHGKICRNVFARNALVTKRERERQSDHHC